MMNWKAEKTEIRLPKLHSLDMRISDLKIELRFQFYRFHLSSDYDTAKYLATRAMHHKVSPSEVRTPTHVWAGQGFSSSMPEAVIRSVRVFPITFRTCQSAHDYYE